MDYWLRYGPAKFNNCLKILSLGDLGHFHVVDCQESLAHNRLGDVLSAELLSVTVLHLAFSYPEIFPRASFPSPESKQLSHSGLESCMCRYTL